MSFITFHPDVHTEVKEAYSWYESQSKGLGDDFINALTLGKAVVFGLGAGDLLFRVKHAPQKIRRQQTAF